MTEQIKTLPEKQEGEPRQTVAWLGPAGNFTDLAAQRLRWAPEFANTRLIEAGSIDEMFEMVEQRITRYALVPYENSTDGPVKDSHRNFLLRVGIQIVSELVLPIEQHAYLRKDASVDSIEIVASKDSALGQCTEHIRQTFPDTRLIAVESTGKAVAWAAEDRTVAAIGSSISASAQGLDDSLDSIPQFNDSALNATTFTLIKLSDELSPPTGNDKTTFIMTIPDRAGGLVSVLRTIEHWGINLNKIKSLSKENGAVSFLVSVDGHELDGNARKVTNGLISDGVGIKRLGSYPRAEYIQPDTDEQFNIQSATLRIQKEAQNGDGHSQTVVVFTLRNEPGTLLKALQPFARKKVNLTKIDSQPSGKFEEYIFYLAFDNTTDGSEELLQELAQNCEFMAKLQ